MSKTIAICIGSRSKVDPKKLKLKFDEYQTGYTLAFCMGPDNKPTVVELTVVLVKMFKDAAIWAIVQGAVVTESEQEREVEEVQIIPDEEHAKEGSRIYRDSFFWDQPAAPEELFARKLFEILTREVFASH